MLYLVPTYELQFERIGVVNDDVNTLNLQKLLHDSKFIAASEIRESHNFSTFTFGDSLLPSIFRYSVYDLLLKPLIDLFEGIDSSELIAEQSYKTIDIINKYGSPEKFFDIAVAGLKEDFKAYNKAKDYLKSKERLISEIDFL